MRISDWWSDVCSSDLLRMLELAHTDHGRLPWARLFDPAIRLAENGFAVSPRLHALIAEDRYLTRYPAAAASFHDAAGNPLPVGAVLKNQAYADTLAPVAAGGADAFYKGPIPPAVGAPAPRAAANPPLPHNPT